MKGTAKTAAATRALISKVGLDGHDRGAKLVAHVLREEGVDVTYLGIRRTLDELVDTAIRKKVEYVGLSFLAGDHMTWIPRVIGALRERNAGDIRVVVGGIIDRDEIPVLRSMGVEQVFLPGTPLRDIAEYIKTHSGAATARETANDH